MLSDECSESHKEWWYMNRVDSVLGSWYRGSWVFHIIIIWVYLNYLLHPGGLDSNATPGGLNR